MLILRGYKYTKKVFETLSEQQYSFKLFGQLSLQWKKNEISLINWKKQNVEKVDEDKVGSSQINKTRQLNWKLEILKEYILLTTDLQFLLWKGLNWSVYIEQCFQVLSAMFLFQ